MSNTKAALENLKLPESTASAEADALYLLNSAHGLASNQVHRLTRDSQSRIWLATPAGLDRFDGSFVEHWTRDNGLSCNGLRCVTTSSNGEIWIGSDLGIELLDADGRPAPCIEPGTWRYGLCQHVDIRSNHPWVGTAQGLVKLERQADRPGYSVAFAAEAGFVSSVFALNDARVLATSAAAGLIETNGSTWWTYRCEAIAGLQITRVVAGPGGELLVGSIDGLYIIDDATGRVEACLTPSHGNPMVTAIAIGKDCFWVAFGRTLKAYAQGSLTPIERYQLTSSVNDLVLDELDNVYIGTNNSGLALASCLRHAVERIDLGKSGGIYAIRPSGKDHFMIGGDQIFGAATLPASRRSARLSGPQGLPDTIVWDTLVNEQGTWAATQSGLYRAAAGEALTHVLADDPVLAGPNRVLLQRGAEIWAGSLRGLARISSDGVQPALAHGSALGYVYCLHQDSQSALWIGTLGRGLWREKDGMEQISVAPLTPNGNTYAVCEGPDRRMLVLQDDMVVVLDRELKATRVATLSPVAGWTALWLDTRTVAIGASDGLRILDLDTGQIVRTINCLLPLPEWEFTNNRTLVKTSDGRLLCGVNAGLLRVDLSSLQRFGAPRCRPLDVKWKGVTPRRLGAAWEVAPGRWSFQARAFSAWFVDAAQVSYQFQLIGFDKDWGAPQTMPVIQYTSLPPGEYRLQCRARSPLTGIGPTTELLRLFVKRPLWAMGWTTALAALDTFYEGLVRSRSRNKALLAQNQALEREVTERTQALKLANAELERVRDAYMRLSEVDDLTQLGNRRSFEREIDRALALVTRLQLPLALLIVDIDHFKLVNDRLGHLVGDDYLRAVGRLLGQAVRVGEDVAARYGGEEFAVLLINSSLDEAVQSADRMRESVAALKLHNPGSPLGVVTISVGVAVALPGQPLTREALIERADQALYRAKNSGRNRVCT